LFPKDFKISDFTLSLDKWIKDNGDNKKTKKKTPKKEIVEEPIEELENQPSTKKDTFLLTKFILTCSDSKCKYKKILRKKNLKDKDKICPRCKKEMKVKLIDV
jgi:hypothetical protein